MKRFFVTSATTCTSSAAISGRCTRVRRRSRRRSATSAKPRNVVVDAPTSTTKRDPGARRVPAGVVDRRLRTSELGLHRVRGFQRLRRRAVPGGRRTTPSSRTTSSTRRSRQRGPVGPHRRDQLDLPLQLGARVLFVDPIQQQRPPGRRTSAAHERLPQQRVYEYNVWQGAKCAPTDVNAASGFVRPQIGNIDLHLTPGSAGGGSRKAWLLPGDGHRRSAPPSGRRARRRGRRALSPDGLGRAGVRRRARAPRRARELSAARAGPRRSGRRMSAASPTPTRSSNSARRPPCLRA